MVFVKKKVKSFVKYDQYYLISNFIAWLFSFLNQSNSGNNFYSSTTEANETNQQYQDSPIFHCFVVNLDFKSSENHQDHLTYLLEHNETKVWQQLNNFFKKEIDLTRQYSVPLTVKE